MLHKQRGLGLIQVAIIMASLAAIAMAFLMSARHERNFFAEGLGKLTGKAPASASASASAAPAVPAAPAGVLRKCVIDGKTVLSDVDCKDGKVVKAIDTRGIEAPKMPKPDPADSAPQSATDKMIEKATR
ncbi:DUF4124 domain-containing protein [Duganella sp. BJB488]|uniref:DUF4124 domain-containing protein n=1 Tax=unclassified Duganella TaxID=2636909 RepID=UPI000E3514C6|nr:MULTISPECIES: DUF4124 domain-containing protein [unclassified Duganella]RFP26322.1 DUF4124 domain-containing protein [Duganella sp. BJB489]RFP27937.1 DUF4124 domain-containing protein [Duganella sp. BJB488]RFP37254.1 DUF4124 domain-containing protein [Duganella sp. BJB480]